MWLTCDLLLAAPALFSVGCCVSIAPLPPCLQVNTSVYVTGLPDDTDVDEVATVFSKCGIIKMDDEGKPKIKLYR